MAYSNTQFAFKATNTLGLFTVFIAVASTIVDAQQVSSQPCFNVNPVISTTIFTQNASEAGPRVNDSTFTQQLAVAEQQVDIANQQLVVAREEVDSANQLLDVSNQELNMSTEQLSVAKQQMSILQQQSSILQQLLATSNQQVTTSLQQLAVSNAQLAVAQEELNTTKDQLVISNRHLDMANQQFAATNQLLDILQRQWNRSITHRDAAREDLNDSQHQDLETTQQPDQIAATSTSMSTSAPAGDCVELLSMGFTSSGQYQVYLDDGKSPGTFSVYCDMETDGGGWTVFQRRTNGSVDFYESWDKYKQGFGDVAGEHWLGNDLLHRLTSQKSFRLRIELEDWDGATAYAEYHHFSIESEEDKYRLTVSGYSGTAGNTLSYVDNGQRFSTKDADNDDRSNYDCAQRLHGAWWYRDCTYTNLNGRYYPRSSSTTGHHDGITWHHWKGNWFPLKKSEMKIRPN